MKLYIRAMSEYPKEIRRELSAVDLGYPDRLVEAHHEQQDLSQQVLHIRELLDSMSEDNWDELKVQKLNKELYRAETRLEEVTGEISFLEDILDRHSQVNASTSKLSPTAQDALYLSKLWIGRAKECKDVEEFCERYVPRALIPEYYQSLFDDLNNNIVYSGERRLNKTPMDTNRLFTRQAAMILIKNGLAELVDEYTDNTVDIRIL